MWLWWSPKCQSRNITVSISPQFFGGNFNSSKTLNKYQKIYRPFGVVKKFCHHFEVFKNSHKSNFFVLIRTLRKEKFKRNIFIFTHTKSLLSCILNFAYVFSFALIHRKCFFFCPCFDINFCYIFWKWKIE